VDALAAEVVLLMKRALAPVLVEQVGQQARIAMLETRPASTDVEPRLSDARERLAALEAKALPPSDPGLTAADLLTATTEQARQAFADLGAVAPPRRMQKRVIRNSQGLIERVVEEPVC